VNVPILLVRYERVDTAQLSLGLNPENAYETVRGSLVIHRVTR